LEIPEELAGQTIECPACNASLAVPSIEVPPPATPQIRVTAPQKPATKRKIAAPPIAASPKKTKSLIPKLAIGAISGVAVVVLIMVFSGGSKDVSESNPIGYESESDFLTDYSGTYVAKIKSPDTKENFIEFTLKPDKSFIFGGSRNDKKMKGRWKIENDVLLLTGTVESDPNDEGVIKIDKTTLRLIEIIDSKGHSIPGDQLASEGAKGIYFKKN
jgi:hypothetical protein